MSSLKVLYFIHSYKCYAWNGISNYYMKHVLHVGQKIFTLGILITVHYGDLLKESFVVFTVELQDDIVWMLIGTGSKCTQVVLTNDHN